MNIAVVAANGRSGKIFVEHALKAGHSIRAGVYKNNTLQPHPRLTIVTCDATQKSDLEQLVQGQDAVVSFIGHVKGSPPRVQTNTMRELISVMRSKKISRLVSLTGTGVRFPGDKIRSADRVLNASINLIDPNRVQDGIDHVALLKQSKLDWTIIRVLKLQNTNPAPFSLTAHGPAKLFVSRHEVAAAALQVLEQSTFIKKAPILSKISH